MLRTDICPEGQMQEWAEGMGQDVAVLVPPLAASPRQGFP